MVHAEELQSLQGEPSGDGTLGADLDEVADAPQQPVGDARGPARALGDLTRPFDVDLDVEDAGGTDDDAGQGVGVVEVEPPHEPEAVAQGTGEQPGPGGGADQRELRQVETDRTRGGSLADEDVELEVLHGGVEHFFHGPREPVDLVDEQHVTGLQIREDRRQVPTAHERRAGGDAKAHPHLGGDDACQGRLSQAGRPGEQQVVHGLAPTARRLEDDVQVLGQLRLAQELRQLPGTQARLVGELGRVRRGVNRAQRRGLAAGRPGSLVGGQQLSAPAHRAAASSRSAWRRSSSTAPCSGTLDRACLISSGP